METKGTLNHYIERLIHLHTSNSGGFKAPHKAILMLTVTEMVRDGLIGSPVVPNNDLLKRYFIKTGTSTFRFRLRSLAM